jgi:hypothetical protein
MRVAMTARSSGCGPWGRQRTPVAPAHRQLRWQPRRFPASPPRVPYDSCSSRTRGCCGSNARCRSARLCGDKQRRLQSASDFRLSKTADQDVLAGTGLQFIEHLEPKLRPLRLALSKGPVRRAGQRLEDRLIADHAVVTDHHRPGATRYRKVRRPIRLNNAT